MKTITANVRTMFFDVLANRNMDAFPYPAITDENPEVFKVRYLDVQEVEVVRDGKSHKITIARKAAYKYAKCLSNKEEFDRYYQEADLRTVTPLLVCGDETIENAVLVSFGCIPAMVGSHKLYTVPLWSYESMHFTEITPRSEDEAVIARVVERAASDLMKDLKRAKKEL